MALPVVPPVLPGIFQQTECQAAFLALAVLIQMLKLLAVTNVWLAHSRPMALLIVQYALVGIIQMQDLLVAVNVLLVHIQAPDLLAAVNVLLVIIL